jgi:hypothetical protein
MPECYTIYNLGPSFWTRDKKDQDKEWYRQGIHTLVSRWRKAVEVDLTLRKNRIWRRTFSLEYVLFSWFWINIYFWKSMGHYFLGNSRNELCDTDTVRFYTRINSFTEIMFAIESTYMVFAQGSKWVLLPPCFKLLYEGTGVWPLWIVASFYFIILVSRYDNVSCFI